MKILYCAQFHELCGYSHAALGYLRSLDIVLRENPEIDFKILSVSFKPNSHSIGKIDAKDVELIEKYHFSDQSELDSFVSAEYVCLWHMTSVCPDILEHPQVGHVYNNLSCSVRSIIHGSVRNHHLLAWETDEIPLEYKQAIARLHPDKVLVPSEWNKQTVEKFHSSGLIPHVIDHPVESVKVPLPLDMQSKFVVFSMSEWVNRKNFESLVKAFCCDFSHNPDAVLVLKTSLPSGTKREDFVAYFKHLKSTIRTNHEKKDNIVVLLDYFSREQINYLYEISDVFVLPSYGEGFSLPTSDAAAHGLPIICSPVGGHTDYLPKDNPLALQGVWETVLDVPPYDIDGRWYVPTVDSLRANLRKAHDIWKSNPQQLEAIGQENKTVALSGRFSLGEVGQLLIEELKSPGANPARSHLKEKIRDIRRRVQNLPHLQKLEVLKNSFEGEECYILNCGPSLKDHDPEKLATFLEDKLVLSVKQAYDLFKDVSDFHFYNCSNLPTTPNPFSGHYNHSKDTISIASSNYKQYARWPMRQKSDVFFKIPVRTEINNEFLVRTGKITESLIQNKPERPCGPGIMYETVLFTALHLGVNKITCIGWDLTKEIVNQSNYEHFYGNTSNLVNKGDILDWEVKETREFSKPFYEWCVKNDVELCLASTQSSLYEQIPRVEMDI